MDDGPYRELISQNTIVKDRVRAVVHGQSNGLYIHGRPGTSKTYLVRSTLETLGARYAYCSGHLTPLGLFDMIAENRDRILVLDDVSSILKQPVALQLLLAALGVQHDGSRVRNVRYKKSNEDQVVPFTGGIIVISNLPLNGHHHEVLAALNDRISVVGYEPTDEQMVALIEKLAEGGIRGVTSEEAQKVAGFLITECKSRGVRPSLRLYLDKALEDFKLWSAENCETDWRDLIVSNLEQQLVPLQHPTQDLSRSEQMHAERRVARDVLASFEKKSDRIAAWKKQTGKSQAAFYRRVAELNEVGQFPASPS